MVQVDISTQPRVLATNCADVATLLNHPALGDCMIVDESSPLCDDVEINPTPSETVQGGTGGTDVRTTASLQASGPVTKKVDTKKIPTLAELLKSQESLRKDKARVKAQYRVELAKPKASDIEAIMQLYADGGHPEWSVLAGKLEAARPFQIPKASFPMILETGQALVRTSNAKILSSLMRDHGNPVVQSLLDSKAIAQVSKLPRGNIRVMVTTADACQQLECQPVTILGERYFFREFDSLETKYYLDVFGVGVEDERINILRSLHRLGCQVVYATFRETIPTKGVVMSTWRIYFASSTCPEALVRVGKVCEQIVFERQLYPVRGKNAPLPTERPRYGQRGPYCLDLGANVSVPGQQQKQRNAKPQQRIMGLLRQLPFMFKGTKSWRGKRRGRIPTKFRWSSTLLSSLHLQALLDS